MPFPWEYERTTTRNRRLRRGFEREARLAGLNMIARRTAQAQGIDPDIVPQRPTMFDKQMITGRHLDAMLEDKPEKRGGGGLLGKIGGAIDDATSFVFGGEIREPWDFLRPLKRALDAEQRYISRPLAEGIYELSGSDYENAPGIVKFGLEALTSPSTFIGPGVAGKLAKVAGLPGARFAAKESTGRYLAQNVGGALGATVGGEVAEQVGLPRAVGGLPGAIVASSALVRGAKPKPPVAEAGGAKGDLPHPLSMAGFRYKAANFGTTEADDALRGALNASGRVARQEARDAAASMEGFWPRWEEDPGYGTLNLDTMGVQPLFASRLETLRKKVNGAKRPLGKDLRELGTLEAQKFVADMRDQGLTATTIMNRMAERIEESIDQFRRTPRSAQQVAFEAELNRLWDEPAFLPFEELGFEVIDGLTGAAVRGSREPVPTGDGGGFDGGGSQPPRPPRPPRRGGGEPTRDDDFPTPAAVNGEQPEAAFRELLGGELPDFELSKADKVVSAVKRGLRLDPDEQPIATTVMRHRKDLKLRAESLANRLSNVAGARARQVFQRDAQGRITNLPLNPTIQDVAARLPRYQALLSDEQLAFMHEIRDELAYYRNALEEMGVDVGSRPDVIEGGFYIPRGGANPEGLDLPTKVGGGGSGRAGSKKGFERPVSFPSQTQGITAGYEYASFEDAIRSYGIDAGNRSIDAYSARVLANVKDESGKLLGETQSMRLWRQNPELARSMEGVRQRVASLSGSAARLDAKTHKVWKDFLDSVDNMRSGGRQAVAGIAEPDLDALRESLIGLQVKRGMFRGMNLEQSKETLLQLKAEVAALRPTWKAAIDKARLAPRDAGQIGIAQLNGTTFPIAMANAANKFLQSEAPSHQNLRALNALMRGMQATADLSWLGIQGLLGLAYDPRAYGRAWKAAMRSLGDPDAMGKYMRQFDQQATVRGLPSAKEWAKSNLRLGGIAHEYAIGGRAGLRGVSQTLGRQPIIRHADVSFGAFGDAMRLEAAQAMHATSKGKNLEQLAQAANLMTGWTKGKFLGDTGEFVQFAPRFFQSQIELVGRAMVDGSETGRQARFMLLKLMGVGTLTTVLANEALGNPTDLNPKSPNFMRIRVAGQDVSLFGPWDSLLRATTRAAGGDFEYLARTKASPILQRTWDALTGRTFIGEPALNPLEPREAVSGPAGQTGVIPERIETFFRQVLPFSVQDTVREGVDPSTALNFAGVKSTPLSRADVLDELAWDAFGKGWHDLSSDEVGELADSNPERIDAKTVQAARGVKETLQPYWDLEDMVWERINDRPEFSGYPTADDYFDAKSEELKKAGVPQHLIARRLQDLPVAQQLQRVVSELRRRYRRQHSDAEELLIEYYNYSPLDRATDRTLRRQRVTTRRQRVATRR